MSSFHVALCLGLTRKRKRSGLDDVIVVKVLDVVVFTVLQSALHIHYPPTLHRDLSMLTVMSRAHQMPTGETWPWPH